MHFSCGLPKRATFVDWLSSPIVMESCGILSKCLSGDAGRTTLLTHALAIHVIFGFRDPPSTYRGVFNVHI